MAKMSFLLYAADADILTFIAMPDWPTPLNVIDPRIEWMAEEWPLAGKLRPFRTLLDQLKTFDLLIGQDGRARAHLRPFGTKSSRNNTAKGGGFIRAEFSVSSPHPSAARTRLDRCGLERARATYRRPPQPRSETDRNRH